MLKILGGESSEVTPVSHAFSGMNVVFGTAPGKGGQVRQCRRSDKPLTVAAVLALRGSVATAGAEIDNGITSIVPKIALIVLPPPGEYCQNHNRPDHRVFSRFQETP
ncbi:hypothetical protein VSR82_32110 [Burkholderia sp. JPY481]